MNQPSRHRDVWKLETKPSQHMHDPSCDTPRTLNKIVETDLVKPPCVWSCFGGGTERVISDVHELDE